MWNDLASGFQAAKEDVEASNTNAGSDIGVELTDAMYDSMITEAENRKADLEKAISVSKDYFQEKLVFSDPTPEGIGGAMISYLKLGLDNGINDYAKDISGIFDRIKNIFKACLGIGEDGVSTVFYNYGQQILKGLKNGLSDNLRIVTDQITTLAISTKNRFAELMEIKSPSGVFEYLGSMLTQGLSKGIDGGMPDVMSSMTDLAKNSQTSFTDMFKNGSEIDTDSLIDSLSGSLSGISFEDLFGGQNFDFASLFGGDVDIDSLLNGSGMDLSSMFDLSNMDFSSLFGDLDGYTPTITPVLDDSSIIGGFGDIQSLFNSSNFSIGGGNLDFLGSFFKDERGDNMIAQLLAEMKGVNSNITGLREENGNMQIIMDSGELVGVMDRGLGAGGQATRRSVMY